MSFRRHPGFPLRGGSSSPHGGACVDPSGSVGLARLDVNLGGYVIGADRARLEKGTTVQSQRRAELVWSVLRRAGRWVLAGGQRL